MATVTWWWLRRKGNIGCLDPTEWVAVAGCCLPWVERGCFITVQQFRGVVVVRQVRCWAV